MRNFWNKFNRNQPQATGPDAASENANHQEHPSIEAGHHGHGGSSNGIGKHGQHHQGLEPIVLPITEAVTRLTGVGVTTAPITGSGFGTSYEQAGTGEHAGKPTYALLTNNASTSNGTHEQLQLVEEGSINLPSWTTTSNKNQPSNSRPGTDFLSLATAAAASSTSDPNGRRMLLGSRDSNRSGISSSRLATADPNSLLDMDRFGKNVGLESGDDGAVIAAVPDPSSGNVNRTGSENIRSRSFAGDPRKGDLLSLASFYKDVKTKTMGDISNMMSLGSNDINNLFGRPMPRRRSEENVNEYSLPFHHQHHLYGNPLARNPSNPPPTPIVVNSSSGGATPSPSSNFVPTSSGPSTSAGPTAVGNTTKPWKLQPLPNLAPAPAITPMNDDRHQHIATVDIERRHDVLTGARSGHYDGSTMSRLLTRKGAVDPTSSTALTADDDETSSSSATTASVPLPTPRGLHLSVNFSNATGRRLAKLDTAPLATASSGGETLQMFRAKTLPGIKSSNPAGWTNQQLVDDMDNQENEEAISYHGRLPAARTSATSNSSLINDPDTDTDL